MRMRFGCDCSRPILVRLASPHSKRKRVTKNDGKKSIAAITYNVLFHPHKYLTHFQVPPNLFLSSLLGWDTNRFLQKMSVSVDGMTVTNESTTAQHPQVIIATKGWTSGVHYWYLLNSPL